VIDGHSSHAFAKLYLSKVPMTAVRVLHDRVLPFYEEHNIEIQHLLTDKVREYARGQRDIRSSCPWLYLAIHQIEHRRTDIGSPETNGLFERSNDALKENFYSAAFPLTFYESMEQLQQHIDEYLAFYNRLHANLC
jgi:hypothetical protein